MNMKLFKFPPIYRAVAFSAGDTNYLLRPANNTIVGAQKTPDEASLKQVSEATHAYANLQTLQAENSRSYHQPQSHND
jgi:hypothetical protein